MSSLLGGEEVGSGCHGDWKRVQAVAQVISHCPSQASSLSHYYSTIGPQVNLFHSHMNWAPTALPLSQLLRLLALPGRATVQVAAATISLMMKHQPALTRSHLIHPLTRPLRLVAAGVPSPLNFGPQSVRGLPLILQVISLRESHPLISVELWS